MSHSTVTVREVRHRVREVIERVLAGERFTVTHEGRPVALLHPVERAPLPREELLRRWRGLPPVDPGRLRSDVDDFADPDI